MTSVTFGDGSSAAVTLGDGTPVFGGGEPAIGSVAFTVAGESFAPLVELVSGSSAQVTWQDDAGAVLASGLAPSMTFESDEPRTVRMLVTAGSGHAAYGQVRSLNVGFDYTEDGGKYGPGPAYDHPPQPVTGVSGLTVLSGLVQFMAASTPLAGALDVSGLAHLEFVECFHAGVESIDLTGCASIIRLCLEANALSAVDLNPVRTTIRDFRSAINTGGHLTLAPLSGPLSEVYHFCVRDQVVTNFPAWSDLPHLEEMPAWNTFQSGALAPVSDRLRSLQIYGNGYTSADFSAVFQAGQADGVRGDLVIDHCPLASINIAGCVRIRELHYHHGTPLSQAGMDALLVEVASWGTSNGVLVLTSAGDGNAAPSATGLAAASTLAGRGWDLTLPGGG